MAAGRLPTYMIIGLLLVGFVSEGRATLEEGLDAYRAGDYVTAFKKWQPLAEEGHAKAQYNLGLLYYNGRGVNQDYAQARHWYLKAAQQGQAFAQNNLGKLYEKGQGAPQDPVQADMWYLLSAAQGNDVAVKNHEALSKTLTAEQRGAAKKQAAAWKRKHTR